MGAGLAKQAAQRYPELPLAYGASCQTLGAATPVLQFVPSRFVLFPVKPLAPDAPHLSWQQNASLPMIERSADELASLEPDLHGGDVVLPMVGCGNGRLERSQVYPVLWRILKSDRFILCKEPRTEWERSMTGIFPAALKVPDPPPPLEGRFEMSETIEYVGREYVTQKTTLSKNTISNYEALGIFPRRRRLGPNRVAWIKGEVDAWCQTRKEGQ